MRYHWVEVNSITTARISIEKNSFSYRQDSLLKDTQRHFANFCSNISFALQFLLKNNNIEAELSWTADLCINLKFGFKIYSKFIESLACIVLNWVGRLGWLLGLKFINSEKGIKILGPAFKA